MTRCTVCGRPPSEDCCDTCHRGFNSVYGPMVTTAQVRKAKQVNGGTISQFAKLVGVAPSTVDGWLYARHRPEPTSARRILAILSETG